MTRQTLDLIEVHAGFRRSPGNLEDDEVAGNATALCRLIQGRTRHVIGHRHDAHVDAFSPQPFGSNPKFRTSPA